MRKTMQAIGTPIRQKFSTETVKKYIITRINSTGTGLRLSLALIVVSVQTIGAGLIETSSKYELVPNEAIVSKEKFGPLFILILVLQPVIMFVHLFVRTHFELKNELNTSVSLGILASLKIYLGFLRLFVFRLPLMWLLDAIGSHPIKRFRLAELVRITEEPIVITPAINSAAEALKPTIQVEEIVEKKPETFIPQVQEPLQKTFLENLNPGTTDGVTCAYSGLGVIFISLVAVSAGIVIYQYGVPSSRFNRMGEFTQTENNTYGYLKTNSVRHRPDMVEAAQFIDVLKVTALDSQSRMQVHALELILEMAKFTNATTFNTRMQSNALAQKLIRMRVDMQELRNLVPTMDDTKPNHLVDMIMRLQMEVGRINDRLNMIQRSGNIQDVVITNQQATLVWARETLSNMLGEPTDMPELPPIEGGDARAAIAEQLAQSYGETTFVITGVLTDAARARAASQGVLTDATRASAAAQGEGESVREIIDTTATEITGSQLFGLISAESYGAIRHLVRRVFRKSDRNDE